MDPGKGDQVSVVRVRTKPTLCKPDISQFIMRGARMCGLPSGGAAIAELANVIGSHACGVFLGFRGEEAKAVAVAQLPSSAFHRAPMISLAYSAQDHDVSKQVGHRLRVWLVECGFHEAVALNRQHTDRSFIRGLGYFGAGEREGSLIRFSF